VLGEEHPETLESMNNLAWLKATCPAPQVRNGIEALKYATKVCELTDWKDAIYLDTLAASYAEAGDFDSAVKWQRKAIELLPESRAGYESRLKRYQAGKPLAAHQETAEQADGQINEKEIVPEKKK
jgi:serine/threonine-protein kinase